jgi:hypothetical protein
MVNKKKKPKRKIKLYSIGEQNYIVDALIHPLIDKNSLFFVLDEALHLFIENDPELSMKKFVRYTLPQIIKKAKIKAPK